MSSMSNTLDALAFASGDTGVNFGKTSKKRPKVKKLTTSNTIFVGGDYSDAGASVKGKNKKGAAGGGILKESQEKVAVRKVEQPQALNIKKDVDRPHEKKVNKSTEQIESDIDKLRARAFMEAKNKIEVRSAKEPTLDTE